MKRIFLPSLVVLLILAAGTAVYRFHFRKSIPQTELAGQIAAILEQNDCLACHATDAPLPFYGRLPGVKGMIAGHIASGTRYVDLEPVVEALRAGGTVTEVDLAKIEQTMRTGSMPVGSYRIIHWGTGFNARERELIDRWVKQERAAHYATGIAAPEFADEPVQPLVARLETDPAKAALGLDLYHDGRLSADGTVSCATCHMLDKGGVDGTKSSQGIRGQWGPINAPTVYNAALNRWQFWDGRAGTLAEQAAGPPTNPIEMGHASWDDIVALLARDRALVRRFESIYPDGVTAQNVTDAIAEFEKTLLTPDSPFDRYLKGEKDALTADEQEGYALFKQHNCATCHVGQAMGGQSFEALGTVADYFGVREQTYPDGAFTDADLGRFGVTKTDADRSKFKTPTLRNVALTAPYLHDGSATTLHDATVTMLDFQVNRKYRLEEVDRIVAFLETLTGQNPMMTYRPTVE